jgi:hypothetical protein
MVAEMETTRFGSADLRKTARIRYRLDRFRRAGMFSEREGLAITQSTLSELREAYRLVHDVFVERECLSPQLGSIQTLSNEALPEMAAFIAKSEGKVVAVMSVLPYSADLDLPSDTALKAELDSLRCQGRRIGETTNLAVDPSYCNGAILMKLTRVILIHGLTIDYTVVILSISDEHAPFFLTVMGFESCSVRRNYGENNFDWVGDKWLGLMCFEQRTLAADGVLMYCQCTGFWLDIGALPKRAPRKQLRAANTGWLM